MTKVPRFPKPGHRIPTGPVQFGDNWPGVYVRGDDAQDLIGQLTHAARLLGRSEGETLEVAQAREGLRSVIRLLDSARVQGRQR